MANEWQCPYCGRSQILSENFHRFSTSLNVGETKYGRMIISGVAYRCANAACNELALSLGLYPGRFTEKGLKVTGSVVEKWSLRPGSAAKPQPDYVPRPLVEDYIEACKIRDLSPKASATLARRCLQGMIRDFCGISKPRLVEEISELRRLAEAGAAPKGVELETLAAIDAIRDIGNIGAHMEKDIDVIVEVDPGEAQALIELLEMLFAEWYVARHERQARLARVVALGEDKAKEKAAARARVAEERAQERPDADE